MKIQYFIFILLLLGTKTFLYGQVKIESQAKIDNIDFTLSDNKVIITYDLLNAKRQERFDIQVSIYKASTDTRINAKTFSGDLYNLAGGKGKTIIWQLAEDLTYLDENIYVLLEATHLNPVTIPYTGKKTAYLQSTAFPGWGTSKMTLNNYHLVKGVAAYSLIALSIKSNYDAGNYYDKYQNATEANERDDYYKKAENSYRNSFYFIGGAAAIWLGEYLWLYLAPNKTDAQNMPQKKVSLYYNHNPETNTPALTLTYKF